MVSKAKAVVGAAIAALTAAAGLAEHANGHVHWWDFLTIAAAGFAGYQGVYWAPRHKRKASKSKC